METKFCHATYSVNSSLIGVFPQCQKLIKGLSNEREDFIYDVLCGRKDVKKDCHELQEEGLDVYRLAYRAKLTDFLSHVISDYPLVSSRALSLLNQFDLSAFALVPSKLSNRDNSLDYFFLIPVLHPIEYFDWSKCVFEVIDSNEEITGLCSFDEYMKVKEDLWNRVDWCVMKPKELFLSKEFPKGLDMIYFEEFGYSHLFFSKRLKNAIIESGLTGLDFVEDVKIILEE